MEGRVQPGDHLKVRRPWLYDHHGIYVSDDRVIQFGSGVTLWDKSRTAINVVSLAEFEDGATAVVVPHGGLRLLTAYDPPADEPWKIVARAEFLLKLQPRLTLQPHRAQLRAHRQHVHRGGWTESYQVRRVFGLRAVASFVFLIWFGNRTRAKLPIPSWVPPVAVAAVLLSLASIETYNHQIKLFWDEIRDDWFAHERALQEDPRNGLPG